MCQKVCNVLAPSTAAAFSSSGGIASKKPLQDPDHDRQDEREVDENEPAYVSISRSLERTMKSGMVMTMPGNIWVASVMSRSCWRPAPETGEGVGRR